MSGPMGEHTQSSPECQSGHPEGSLQKGSTILQLRRCDDAAPRPTDSLLQRINHLDIILNAMEDKASTEPSTSTSTSPRLGSRRYSSAPTTPFGLEKRCKPAESVLEEIQEKGTIIERVSDLEDRVMKFLSLNSNENVDYPSIPHRRVKSQREAFDRQLLQEPIDVEKHEVIHSGPSQQIKGHNELAYVDPVSHDTYSTKSESPHGEHYEDMVSKQDPRAPTPPSKKKKLRIRKWLSKRLHIHLPGTPKVETRQ